MEETGQLLMRRPNLEGLPPLPEPPPGYVLRLLRSGEEEALARTLANAFPDHAWPVEKALRDLVEAPDVLATFVVAHNGLPIATASARDTPNDFPNSGYLHWVACDPAHQGQGLGVLVTLRVLHHFREQRYADSVLETDDFRLPAIRTYLRLGYQPVYRAAGHEARWQKIIEGVRG